MLTKSKIKEVPPPNISCTLTFPLHEFSCATVGMFLSGYTVCIISFFHLIFPRSNIFYLDFPGQLLLHSFSNGPSLEGKNTTATPNQAWNVKLLPTSSRSWQSWAMMARQPCHRGFLCLIFLVHPHASGRENQHRRERLDAAAREKNFYLPPPRLVFLVWDDFHARSRFASSTIPEKKWGVHVLVI